jgi:hypothetical protein
MTCEEFRSLILIDPRNLTSAEREATIRHERNCLECRTYMEQKTEEYIKTLIVRELNDIYKEIDKEIDKANDEINDLILKDSNDPETNY